MKLARKTRTTNKLIKHLKRNRNKFTGGGPLSDFFTKYNPFASSTITQNTTKVPYSIEQKKYTLKKDSNNEINNSNEIDSRVLDRSENLTSYASNIGTSAILINGMMVTTMPFLALSGVGLPLVGLLFLCKSFVLLYGHKIELKAMFQDMIMILENCYYLENLISTTMNIFQTTISKLINENKIKQENIKQLKQIYIDARIKQRIRDKLSLLNELLIRISPVAAKKVLEDIRQTNATQTFSTNATFSAASASAATTSKWESIKNFASKTNNKLDRFFYSEKYKANIIKELSMINSLFIFYNSQFEWIIKLYERFFNNYIENGNKILQSIWEIVENTDEYKQYLHMPDNIMIELDKDVKSLNPQQLEMINSNISNAIVRAETAPEIIPEMDTETDIINNNNIKQNITQEILADNLSKTEFITGGIRKRKTKRNKRNIKNKTQKWK